MANIGNPIISTDFPKDTFSGNGSTTAFTMSIAPASVNAVIVVVSGITQDPSTYTISGTTLTFSAAPPTGTSNISVRHLGVAGIPNVPSDASVTSAKLASGAALANLGTSQLARVNMPIGSILQVVNSTMSSAFSTSSTSWVDTGFTATITPTSSTSKILILFNAGGLSRPGVASECMRLQIVRGASSVIYGGSNLYYTTDTFSFSDWPAFWNYLDSPATTSATTYKIQMQTRLGNSCGMNNSYVDQPATIQLLEIAA